VIKRPVFFTLIFLLTLHTTTQPSWMFRIGGAFTAYYLYKVQQHNNQLLRELCKEKNIDTPAPVTAGSAFVELTGGALQWTASKAIELATGTSPNTEEKNENTSQADDVKALVLAALKELAKSNNT
jgi:hypothetical protein